MTVMAQQKTALVTGANRGLGLEISRQLAQQGYEVFMGMRDTARGAAAVAVATTEVAVVETTSEAVEVQVTSQH